MIAGVLVLSVGQCIVYISARLLSIGSSTVPAAVVIVVKHRACLLVGRLIIGVYARLLSRL